MNKKILIILIIFSTMLAVMFTTHLFIKETQKPKLPILGQVHKFSLIDQDSKTVTLNHLKGKVWIASFVFTTCGDVCPIMSQNMAKLDRTFEQMKDIKLVSISVNPEFDQPERLKEYAKKYETSKNKWYFLTGEREDIKKLVIDSFKLGSIEEPIFHSTYFTLVDKYGYIRGYYDGLNQDEINKLFKHTAFLDKH